MTLPTRRQAIVAGAALPMTAAMVPAPAFASGEMLGSGFAPWNRFKLGGSR